jgi:hypothetical protein
MCKFTEIDDCGCKDVRKTVHYSIGNCFADGDHTICEPCQCDCHHTPESPVSPVETVKTFYLVVALDDLNIVRYQRLFKDLDKAYDCGMKWQHKFKDKELDIEIQLLLLGETGVDDYRVSTLDVLED